MVKVGITGGIGSGKTTVCKLFEILGVPVYYADIRAKLLMTENAELVHRIKDIFGDKVYDENGNLNREHLASLVFSDIEKLKTLNGLVHPAVAKDSVNWQKEHSDFPYTLKEAALLFESGSHKLLDKLITVYAPLEVRIERVIQRDKTSRELVLSRVEKQMPEEEKMKLADFILINDGEHSIIHQVLTIHAELLEHSEKIKEASDSNQNE